LRDWADKFQVTKEQIKKAVRAVGDRAEAVEMHLKGGRRSERGKRPFLPGPVLRGPNGESSGG
jgi:hypothetical protein